MNIHGFEFPNALFYLAQHDVWAQLHADDTATVGITSLGIHLAGEIYMCRVRDIGTAVEQARAVAVVELAKAIVSVKSPVSGQVIQVNQRLAVQPELVHQDPYGQGWIARIKLRGFAADRAQLVQGQAAALAMQEQAWLNKVV
jgi:glycine cleavage system H protein